jgi:hypothetical protein
VVGALIAAPVIASAQQSGKRNGAEAQQRAQVERVQRDLDQDRFQDRDRDRVTEPDQDRDRDRIQDRTHAPDEAKQAEERVYGHELMTDAERLAYQERLRNASTAQEREQVMAQHREEIEVRAGNRNIELDEAGNPVPED